MTFEVSGTLEQMRSHGRSVEAKRLMYFELSHVLSFRSP